MKSIIGFLFTLIVFTSCNNGDQKVKTALPKAKVGQEIATFAGGCFWGMQEGFIELKGVIKSTSGYAGGAKKDPTYEEVSAEQTGHAEAVQVIYDPNTISFEQLLAAFFTMHDPTQLNRQGPDIGTSYRSVAFYNNAEEKKKIEEAILKFNRSGLHLEPVVTEIKAFDIFYPAEAYHQNYYKLNPSSAYVANVCGPKVEKLRKAFPELLKDEYK
ncbi:peptide-methionine (S)-S-oxide reductase MsrA [Pedobacter polaris]|uniref:Peptide methionine sulfoxide reductase MsrA n=1 Tax=Pedobacter polaris TaxID=2571273 RepID=A0A4U1CRD8_9SPHI|nr:peptide-methionine (S)-S-oxide reductase MsrA [Pedobacter polaris]TKC08322.1 peptide-methionine (S)-S-oxide reductase MsrA [Pedobacter polaris]